MIFHATAVVIGGRGVLLSGASGRGKSDLALRLIDRGAMLLSDDYVELSAEQGRLLARVPATIAGRMEVRGIGLIAMPHVPEAVAALLVDLDAVVERLPDRMTRELCGIALPSVTLAAFEASAPIKVELALKAAAKALEIPSL